MKITDERMYDALESCGGHAGWAAKRLRCPVTRVSEAVYLLMTRRRERTSDVDFEIRKHAALAELSTPESVR